MSLGWVFLAIFILSGYFFNKLSDNQSTNNFQPIEWSEHMQIFRGAIQCNLLDDALMTRKQELKDKIFSKVTKKVEKENGFVYYFENDNSLLKDALDFIEKEKACCPFFKFDISILPFDNGFAIGISGSKDAIEMLRDFENNDI